MKHLKFATGNKHKVEEARAILGFKIEQIDLDIPEIQSIDVVEVAVQKAKSAYTLAGEPVIVEDAGIIFEALNGLPGAFIKYFVASLGIAGLPELIITKGNKRARGIVCVAMYDGEKTIIGVGEVKGSIVDTPRGESGFGWDPIFLPDGYDTTFAEMTSIEKNVISHRKLAFKDFKAQL